MDAKLQLPSRYLLMSLWSQPRTDGPDGQCETTSLGRYYETLKM